MPEKIRSVFYKIANQLFTLVGVGWRDIEER
jgi:hypothetical protein